MNLLEVQGLTAAYGASRVLLDIELKIDSGEVVALLGRNGMGKTTLVRSIVGLKAIESGEILFAGQNIAGVSADRIARLGVGLVPEGRQIFPNLSVEEHLSAFSANRNRSGPAWTPERVFQLFPRLLERRNNMGNQLSGGEQQMLAIGRALVTNPRLLILDEATEGLAPLIRAEIWACLSRLRAAGQTILVIDKYVDRLIGIADRHLILERGRIVWRGSSSELQADRAVWHRYLGV